MKKNIFLFVIVGVLLATCGAFYGGMSYGRNGVGGNRMGGANLSPEERQARFQQFGGGMMNGEQKRFRTEGGFVAGEVIAKDAQSITVKLRDGGSKIVLYSDSVEVDTSVKGTITDIEIGNTISVNGKSNQDGSVSAQSIQIRPAPIVPITAPSAQ